MARVLIARPQFYDEGAMGVPTIRELLVFARVNRTRFAQRIAAFPGSDADLKTATGGPSLAGILAEMINREDRIVNALIRGRAWPPPKGTAEFPSVEAMIAWMKEVEARTDAYLDMTSEAELRQRKPVIEGVASTLTAEDWLFQLLILQLHGLGQIVNLMRLREIQPPAIRWSLFR